MRAAILWIKSLILSCISDSLHISFSPNKVSFDSILVSLADYRPQHRCVRCYSLPFSRFHLSLCNRQREWWSLEFCCCLVFPACVLHRSHQQLLFLGPVPSLDRCQKLSVLRSRCHVQEHHKVKGTILVYIVQLLQVALAMIVFPLVVPHIFFSASNFLS